MRIFECSILANTTNYFSIINKTHLFLAFCAIFKIPIIHHTIFIGTLKGTGIIKDNSRILACFTSIAERKKIYILKYKLKMM
jgi:hypothetical protein